MRAASLARKSSLLKNIGVSDFSICCKMEGSLEMAGTCRHCEGCSCLVAG